MEDRETKTVTMKGVFIMHRKKLTTEQKIQMVKLYFEEKASKTEIAERYGVDHALVRDYIPSGLAPGAQSFQTGNPSSGGFHPFRLGWIGGESFPPTSIWFWKTDS